MGWNDLSPKQQADWKKKNFDMTKTVTESQLDLLRKEGTPERAIAKYGKDASMQEALKRFYGADALPKTQAKPKPLKPGDKGFIGPVYDPTLDPKNNKPKPSPSAGPTPTPAPAPTTPTKPSKPTNGGGTKGPQPSGSTTPQYNPKYQPPKEGGNGFHIPLPHISLPGFVVGSAMGGPVGGIIGGLIGGHLPKVAPAKPINYAPGGRMGGNGSTYSPSPSGPVGAGSYMGGNPSGYRSAPRVAPSVSNPAPTKHPVGPQFGGTKGPQSLYHTNTAVQANPRYQPNK